MGFSNPDIHKLKDGRYRALFTWQDLDETTGTLADLKLWVESLIKHHGEGAEFEIEHPNDEEGGRASYRIERDAMPAEIQGWEKHLADAKAERERLDREEYEKLRARFEQGKSV